MVRKGADLDHDCGCQGRTVQCVPFLVPEIASGPPRRCCGTFVDLLRFHRADTTSRPATSRSTEFPDRFYRPEVSVDSLFQHF